VQAEFARLWRAMPKVVFSKTLDSVGWNSRRGRGDVVEVATRLKAETDGLIEVPGGIATEDRSTSTPSLDASGSILAPTQYWNICRTLRCGQQRPSPARSIKGGQSSRLSLTSARSSETS